MLGLTYVDHSLTSFLLPSLLPQIQKDLTLTDGQSAQLVSSFTAVYAAMLIPAGVLADRVPSRPKLLAAGALGPALAALPAHAACRAPRLTPCPARNRPAGCLVWSLMSFLGAEAESFDALLACRMLFAAAQALQNPIAFGMIPELFPRQKSAALAIYNSFM